MIFISYNHKDKVVVQPIAARLAEAFGMKQVFFDTWAIQPGDSIIGKMNAGLVDAKFFFFFRFKKQLTK